MASVKSKDGTSIAYDRRGSGPAVILVDGALSYRGMGPSQALAQALARHFTAFSYDRRGRGESGDTAAWSVERELEDIEALLTEAGGTAFVWGHSSGAVLALEAARRFPGILRLALYEAPFLVDDSRPPIAPSWEPIRRALAAGRRGDAIRLFLRMVGVPGVMAAVLRLLPMWRKLEAVAPTLPRDGDLVQDYQRGEPLPAGRWALVTVPTLALAGGKSPEWMRTAMKALAAVLPIARFQVVQGQAHDPTPRRVVPLLDEFFGAQRSQRERQSPAA